MDVLSAIVRDYVGTREPVGSRAIVERHGGKISASAPDGKSITFTAVFSASVH